jgi:hypothetical protein
MGLALRVHRRLEEGHRGNARNLDRILKCQEQAGGGALARLEFEHADAIEQHFPGEDLIILLAGQHIAERRLARSVTPHDRVNFALGQR